MGEDFSNSLSPHSYLAGIVSFGPKICGTPGFPGVYTVIHSIQLIFMKSYYKSFYLVFIRVFRESISTLIGLWVI